MMLSPVTPEEIRNIDAILSSREASVASRGLSQAYCETSMPSRLSMLWAAAEEVFGGVAVPLLNEEEVRCLVDKAKHIESLGNDLDRLKRLKEALSSPDRLPLLTRNERMARAIAPIMSTSVDDVYRRVRTASRLRGRHGHQLSENENWENIEDSEKFLQEALLCYLRKQKKS
jgi:hypothetical protein